MTEAENDALVAAFLRDRDATCPSCGYNLRDLTTARCPECNWRLELTLRVIPRSLSAWLALVIIFALNASFGIICIIGTALRGWPEYNGKRYQIFYAAYLYQMLTIPALATAIIGRRFLLRASLVRQWIDAAIVATLSITAFVTLLKMLGWR